MDGLIKQIYRAIQTETHLVSTLLVLLGDHGMNDAGNHGGAAPGETSAALTFISPKLSNVMKGAQAPIEARSDFAYYKVVEQSDIVPTLASLLGFPVPLNNLGVFIPEFLNFWTTSKVLQRYQRQLLILTDAERVRVLEHNARQVHTVVKATFGHTNFESSQPKRMNDVDTDSAIGELQSKWAAVEAFDNSSTGTYEQYAQALMDV